MDCGLQPCAFIEGIKADMFYEIDPINLYFIDLSSKLNRFDFFAPDNGPYVIFRDANDAIFYSLPGPEMFFLLFVYFPYGCHSSVVAYRKGQVVGFSQLILKTYKLL